MKFRKILASIVGLVMFSQTIMISPVSASNLDGSSNVNINQFNNVALDDYESQNTIDVVWKDKGKYGYNDRQRQSFEDDLVSKLKCAEKFYTDLYGKAIDITLNITEMDMSFDYESDGFPGINTSYDDDDGHPIVNVKYSLNVVDFYTLETLSHEYAHALMCSIGVALDTNEGSSLCEALCDVLGCCVSAYTNNEYNWIQGHDPIYRDIAQCEFSWNGDNIDTISNYNDMDLEVGIYNNSFILSNTAYLISQYFGDDIDTFSKLFINSICDIANTSGVGYFDFGKIMILNASNMLSNQEITREQFNGIMKSFKTNGMDYNDDDDEIEDAENINDVKNIKRIKSIQYNGHTYIVYKCVMTSWEKARDFCFEHNGYLVNIETESENMYISDFIYNNNITEAFIGAYTEGNDDDGYCWKWSKCLNSQNDFPFATEVKLFNAGLIVYLYVPNKDTFLDDCKNKYLKYSVASEKGSWTGTTAYGCNYFIMESNTIGDINMNGTFDTIDILLIKEHILNISNLILPSLADINQDGCVDIIDIMSIIKFNIDE